MFSEDRARVQNCPDITNLNTLFGQGCQGDQYGQGGQGVQSDQGGEGSESTEGGQAGQMSERSQVSLFVSKFESGSD